MAAVQGELDASKDDKLLLECMAELYGLAIFPPRSRLTLCIRFLINRMPAKALPLFLRLRRPDVFTLIREHNLFAAVQNQALLLVEFDRERRAKNGVEEQEEGGEGRHGAAIKLLVDHTHSIPVSLSTSLKAPGATIAHY